MKTLHPVMAQALAPFMPAKPASMNLTLTLNASDLSAVTKVLDCKKRILLEGNTPYMERAHEAACVHAFYQLIYGNAETTGMNAMLAEVAKITADIDGEFAAMRVQSAIEADRLNDHDKANQAHVAQMRSAVNLQRKYSQTEAS